MKKLRLDQLVVKNALADSREKAQSLIMSGAILVNDEPRSKSGEKFFEDAVVRIKTGFVKESKYVSRGGLKLEAALREFNIDCKDKVALDVGASTGGFTDCLLQNGIKKVIAIDVGHSQLDWKIRSHPSVIAIEKINAKNMSLSDIGEKVDIIVVDVSFISLRKLFEALYSLLNKDGVLVTLIKPQFEVGREFVGKGGIVKDQTIALKTIDEISESAHCIGFYRQKIIPSPITGTDGNHEYLALWTIQSK